MPQTLSIYTIGHSDHTAAAFIDLLRQHDVAVVVDVRSQPYSRWAPQFNRETLEHDLEEVGIAYRFMGDALGGRPADSALYAAGRPDYGRIAQSEAYQHGIERLLELARTARIAIMCGEGDHRECHRHLLISQTLLKRGVRVIHITPTGRTLDGEQTPEQLTFF